jgi:hypothetical protein
MRLRIEDIPAYSNPLGGATLMPQKVNQAFGPDFDE